MVDSGAGGSSAPAQAPRRRSGPKSRTSPYVGVTQYKRTGRWEAHIWVQQPRGKGFQRHLGSYETAEDAARCYDRAAIRFRGPTAELNFAYDSYGEDEFLKAHARTEKFKFLELMRATFAIQTTPQGPPQRGQQRTKAAQAAPKPRQPPRPAAPAADSPSPASSGRLLFGQEPLVKLEPKAEDDHVLLHNPLASDFMSEPLPAWCAMQSDPPRDGEAKQRAAPLLDGGEQRSKVQRTGFVTLPAEPFCLSLQFETGRCELVAALPTPAAQLKPAAMNPWDNSTDLHDWLSPGDMAGWEGGF